MKELPAARGRTGLRPWWDDRRALKVPRARRSDAQSATYSLPLPHPSRGVSVSLRWGVMRAELQGKLDPESTLDTARLEDALTDAVFSAVR